MKGLKVFSAFDGMSNGLLALIMAGITVERYVAAEIDNYAKKVAKHNFPFIEYFGDGNICNIDPYDLRDFHMIMGGSPCQGFSVAGKKTGLTTNDGILVDSLKKYQLLKKEGYAYDKSSLKYFNVSCLLWEYVRIYEGIKKYNPNVKFFLENVVSEKWGKFITKVLGVEPIRINSSTVSAQNRDRYYWTNIEYTPINSKDIKLWDIIPDAISGAGTRGVPQPNWVYSPENKFKHVQKTTVRLDGLANCLTVGGGKLTRKYLATDGTIKLIKIHHAEQLQNVPVGYTNVPGVSESQRFKMLGNGWTVDVITHFFTCLKYETESKMVEFV